MRIKVIESPGFSHDGQMYYEGNTYPDFPDAAGRAYAEAGMVEDLDGQIETGVRDASKTIVLEVGSTSTAHSGGLTNG